MNNKLLKNLITHMQGLETEREYKEFLVSILTPAELEEIPKRLEIVKQLRSGKPHHQIAKELGVGVATVTRGSREIKLGRFKDVENEKR